MIAPRQIDWRKVVDEYVEGVVSGETIAGESVRFACQRHLDDLKRDDIYFDEQEATRACRFFQLLRFSDGAYLDKPFELLPPQAFIVWSVMGWRLKSGLRRYRYAFVDVARGNGKTPLAAGLVLLLTGFDGEAGAEGNIVATKREQARDYCFRDAKRFSEKAQFVKHGHVKLTVGAILFPGSGSTIKALGSDSKTQDSMRTSCLVVEELHAWTKHDKELWSKLQTSLGKRDQPFCLVVTTHGNEMSEIWRREYFYAKSVVDPRQPITDDSVFAYIAELDEGDDIYCLDTLQKANPLMPYGVVKSDHLRTMAAKAKVSSQERVSWKRFHCNIYAPSHDKAVSTEMWAAGRGEMPDLKGKECRLGLDLGWRKDLAALAAVFPLERVRIDDELKRTYAIKVWSWCPSLETERNLSVPPWCDWIEEGHLARTDTKTTDTTAIFNKLEELRDTYWVKSLALDGNNAREFGTRVIEKTKLDVYEFPQNCRKYHEPTQEFLNALTEGRIRHGDNPLLAWACDNLILKRDASNYCMPDKLHAEDKIDPVVAVIMALSEVMFNEQISGSYYEDNPIEIW